MRVLIAIAQVPFVRRATEMLAEDLAVALRRRGDRAEVVRVPFNWRSPEQFVDHIVATRLMDWTGAEASLGDVLIALEFPAYLIPHPRKILWLAHDGDSIAPGSPAIHHGGASEAMEVVRRARRDADRKYLPDVVRRFAVSAGVAASLRRRTALDATPLYPPPRGPERFAWQRAQDYFLVPPGVPPERVELALVALAATSSPIHIKHCGRPDERIDHALRDTAGRLGVSHRVDWLGEVSDESLAQLYGSSFAVLYPSLDDTLNWVALHAGLASKAAIVCSDSGAPAELIRHGYNGAVVGPDSAEIAAALDELWDHPERTAALGRAGRTAAVSPVFAWPHVLAELLRADEASLAVGGGR